MPSFAYTGRNARGELIKGRIEGNDSGAVADELLTTMRDRAQKFNAEKVQQSDLARMGGPAPED